MSDSWSVICHCDLQLTFPSFHLANQIWFKDNYALVTACPRSESPPHYPKNENHPYSPLPRWVSNVRNKFEATLVPLHQPEKAYKKKISNGIRSAQKALQIKALGGQNACAGGDVGRPHAPVQIQIWEDCIFPRHHRTWSIARKNRPNRFQ